MSTSNPYSCNTDVVRIPLSDKSEVARAKLVEIFDACCRRANDLHPQIPVHEGNLDYVTDTVDQVRRGVRVKGFINSRRALLFLMTYRLERPQCLVSGPILRFVSYIGDIVEVHGRFRISLPKAIAILLFLCDVDDSFDHFGIRQERRKLFVTTTEKGARELGIAFAVEIKNFPNWELASEHFNGLSDWSDL